MQLVEILVNCCKMGYGKTRGDVLKIVKVIMKKKGRKHEGCIPQGWWCRFCDEDEVPNDLSGDPIAAQCESSQTADNTHSHNDFLPVFAPEVNGFDVYEDSDYVSWLQFYHPESAPALSAAAAFSCVSPLLSVSQSENNLA